MRFVLSPDSRQAGGSDRDELRDAAPGKTDHEVLGLQLPEGFPNRDMA